MQVLREDWSVVVLHDIVAGCAGRLGELLRRLDDLGVTFEQDFPDSVTITRAGRVVGDAERYMAE
jgi:peptidoglycan-N-acetylglucosamine deacetylase